jgi:acetoin utilization deacetylase AcuC-like enzyme
MALLYYDECFLEHDTGPHPESPERLRQIERHLSACGLMEACRRPTCPATTPDVLTLVHTEPYVQHMRQFAALGGGLADPDTLVSPRSYDVALKAAGAACDAVCRVAAGEDRTALCLVRPPGHHAVPSSSMGFCLFNNVAVAARLAITQLDVDRVLIVDWDVHHGNGTQDAFWRDEQVGFLSIHRSPFYPGTGDAGEAGAGPGLGTTVNLPVTFGTDRREYLKRFRLELDRFAALMQPELVLISAGFDTHYQDPIGSLGLETEDFAQLTQDVLEVADAYAQGRVVSLLEGGYNTRVLPLCVETHLRQLLQPGC